MKKRTFHDLLKDIGFGVKNMRSSYVTWFYNKKQSTKSKNDLAKKMRHSAETASLNYYKVETKPKFDKKKWQSEYQKTNNKQIASNSASYYERNKATILEKRKQLRQQMKVSVSQ
jgi:phage gpG-like protein